MFVGEKERKKGSKGSQTSRAVFRRTLVSLPFRKLTSLSSSSLHSLHNFMFKNPCHSCQSLQGHRLFEIEGDLPGSISTAARRRVSSPVPFQNCHRGVTFKIRSVPLPSSEFIKLLLLEFGLYTYVEESVHRWDGRLLASLSFFLSLSPRYLNFQEAEYDINS